MRLISLKFLNERYDKSHVIYLTTRRHSAYHQWYTHHRLNSSTLGDERFAALCDSSKSISFYANFSALITFSFCKFDSQLQFLSYKSKNIVV